MCGLGLGCSLLGPYTTSPSTSWDVSCISTTTSLPLSSSACWLVSDDIGGEGGEREGRGRAGRREEGQGGEREGRGRGEGVQGGEGEGREGREGEDLTIDADFPLLPGATVEFCITMLTVLCGKTLQSIFYHSAVAVVLSGVVWRYEGHPGERGVV